MATLCPFCGKELEEGALSCGRCGGRPKRGRRPLVAVLAAAVALAAAVVVAGCTASQPAPTGGAQGSPLYVMTSAVQHSGSSETTLLQQKLDEHGNIVERTTEQADGVRATIETQYDGNGLPTSGTVSAEYDAAWGQGVPTGPNALQISAEADDAGRLARQSMGLPGDAGYTVTEFTYHDSGTLKTAAQTTTLPGDYYQAKQTITREFGEDGLITAYSFKSDYDASGGAGVKFDWKKDATGHPTAVTMRWEGTGATVELALETDEHGNILRMQSPGDDSAWIGFSYQPVESPSVNAAAQNGVFDLSQIMGTDI